MPAMRQRSHPPTVFVGYSAGRGGRGIAYARVSAPAERLLRIEFRVPTPLRGDKDAAPYAALTATAHALARRGFSQAAFVVEDAAFVDEIATGRDVGEARTLAYVKLRCALNSFTKSSVHVGATDDLTQRARAEVALNLAA